MIVGKITPKLSVQKLGATSDIIHELILMKNSPSGSGTILLKGLPIDDYLPPTPETGLRKDYNKTTSIAESILVGVSAILGCPIGNVEEKCRHLVHDVIPVNGSDNQLSNEGSIDFGLHTENAVFQDREQFLALLCLRPDPWKEAATPVVDAREIIPLLEERTVSELRKVQFILRKPHILDKSDTVTFSKPVAILSGPIESLEIRCSLYDGGTNSITKVGQKALDALEAVANQQAKNMKTEAGDMLIINNKRVLHGRKAFRTSSKGNNRHLLRVYIMNSLWNLRAAQKDSIHILERSIFKN